MQFINVLVKLDALWVLLVQRECLGLVSCLFDDVWDLLKSRKDLDPVHLTVSRELEITSEDYHSCPCG